MYEEVEYDTPVQEEPFTDEEVVHGPAEPASDPVVDDAILKLDPGYLTAHKRELVKFPDKRLKKKCKPVKVITDDVKQLILDMYLTMKANQGVGIAAPQVGDNRRIVVFSLTEEPLVMINPAIIKREGKFSMVEGCLSLPEYFQTIERDDKITVVYTDADGREMSMNASGIYAAAIQHEIDHLDGKTMVDHLPFAKRLKFGFQWNRRSH